MNLTKRDKVIHLLNRFGLGASEADVETFSKHGVDGAIDRLVHYEQVEDNFPVRPWEFMFDKNGKVAMNVPRVALWWLMRMAATDRPMEEKLTLFWHNHFAVSGAKVEFAPMMLDYVNVMRRNASGNFHTLLDAVAKTPAMLRWLDTDRSLKGRPNENFGRELMELFTLGIGHYTESDVKANSRAFSGWSIRYPLYELGDLSESGRVRFAIDHDMPMAAFQDSPALHDDSFKTVVGQSGPLTAEDVLDIMAHHPATAWHLCKKLWEWFVYKDPEPAVVDRLAKVWTDSSLNIKETMLAIADSPEFWSDRAVNTMVKSPVDFVMGAARQVGLGRHLLARRVEFASYDTPMDGLASGDLYTMFRSIANQGLMLLYPPDVSGWRWGAAWVSASGTLERIRFNDFLFAFRGQNSPAFDLIEPLMALGPRAESGEIVEQIANVLVLDLPEAKREILVNMVKQSGGAKNLKTPASTMALARKVGRLLLGSPEYQLC